MYSLIQVFFCINIFFFHQVKHSTGSPCIRIITVYFQSLIEISLSSQCILLLQVNFPSHQICFRISRRDFNQTVQFLLGYIIVFLSDTAQNQIMPQRYIFRIKLQSLDIVFYCTRKVILLDTSQTSNLVCIYHKRISFDSFRTVLFRSLEIIQIDFCQTTEKIRVRQIGFSIDNLIEILDGQHIVLEIERISPNSHYTVRVNLGTDHQWKHPNPKQVQ